MVIRNSCLNIEPCCDMVVLAMPFNCYHGIQNRNGRVRFVLAQDKLILNIHLILHINIENRVLAFLF